MKLVLGTHEKIVKSWDYAKSSNNSEEFVSNLTVTNKRIVSSTTSSHCFAYREIALSSVKSIFCFREVKSNKKPILSIVFGSILILLSFLFIFYLVSTLGDNNILSMMLGLMSVTLLTVGIVLLVKGASNLNRGTFCLQIITSGTEGLSLEIGAPNSKIKSLHAVNDEGVAKINISVIEDICQTLGAEIINHTTR